MTNEKEKKEFLFIKNEFNTIPLKRLSLKEIDLLFYLFSRLTEKKDKIIIVYFSQIKKILNFKPTDIKRMNNLVDRTNKKLVEINISSKVIDKETGNLLEILFPIFHIFTTDKTAKTVKIQIHENFEYFLNNFKKGEFTKINLCELISLKNNYSKKIYPILTQFRQKGNVYLKSIDEWKEFLNIPKKYEYKKINQNILQPTIKELSKYFKNLNLITTTSGSRKITHIGFNFEPLKIEKKEISIFDLEKENKKYNIIDINKPLIYNDDGIVWD